MLEDDVVSNGAFMSIDLFWRYKGIFTVVAQECDDEIVAQCEQVHGIPEEVGDPVVLRDERHEEELEDVEESPDGKEGAD